MSGFQHVAGFYASAADFRSLVEPFLVGALTAGDPVIVGYDERKSDLVRSWVGEEGIEFAGDARLYATPSRAIATYSERFTQLIGGGAARLWITGELPDSTRGEHFAGWDRYESAINSLWGALPLRSLCLYDATGVSATVRDVVERTHTALHTPRGEQLPCRRYQRPEVFTALAALPDPLEATPPRAELVDPMPGEARDAVAAAVDGMLADRTLDDLLLAVSEAATNARLHGGPPATLRIWTSSERLVVHVHDTGPGPRDPFAGLVPPPSAAVPGGRGVWLIHQLDLAVDLMHAPDGFTVRLRAGRGVPAAN